MPPNVSTNCTMTCAMVSLVRRYATADSRRNQTVSQVSGMKPVSTHERQRPVEQQHPGSDQQQREHRGDQRSRPSSNRSEIESTSETCREMTRPEV